MAEQEKKARKYYNRSALSGLERGVVGQGHKVLKLRFTAYDKDEKSHVNKFLTLFLNEESNERNRETLLRLGCTRPPEMVTFDAVAQEGALSGIGNNVVDLVEEENNGYWNVKYVNDTKFDLKVFDMRQKDDTF